MSYLFGNIVDWVQGQIDAVVSLLFNAASWLVGLGLTMTAKLWAWVATFLPAPLHSALSAMHTSIQTGTANHAIQVITYLLDLACNVDLILLCVSATFTVWAASASIKLALNIKGHIWSASA